MTLAELWIYPSIKILGKTNPVTSFLNQHLSKCLFSWVMFKLTKKGPNHNCGMWMLQVQLISTWTNIEVLLQIRQASYLLQSSKTWCRHQHIKISLKQAIHKSEKSDVESLVSIKIQSSWRENCSPKFIDPEHACLTCIWSVNPCVWIPSVQSSCVQALSAWRKRGVPQHTSKGAYRPWDGPSWRQRCVPVLYPVETGVEWEDIIHIS